MELKEVKIDTKEDWRQPSLTIDSKSFPNIKDLGIKNNVHIELIGDVKYYKKDSDGVERYEFRIKKIGIGKNDSKQIKAKSMAEEENKNKEAN